MLACHRVAVVIMCLQFYKFIVSKIVCLCVCLNGYNYSIIVLYVFIYLFKIVQNV